MPLGAKLLSVLGLASLVACTSEMSDPAAGSGNATTTPGGSSNGGTPGTPVGTGATPGTTAGTGSSPAVNGGASSTGGGTSTGGASGPGTGGSGGSATNSNCATSAADVGTSVLRRLSGLEYQLTLQGLFQLASLPSIEGIPLDNDKDGFRTFAEVQTISAQHLRAYSQRAKELADALLTDSARRAKVLGCEPTAAGCLRTFLARFGKLAYRRALESAEVEALATRAEKDALDSNDQFRFSLEVLLSSPDFLYRVEVGNAPDALSVLTPSELAARLSFGIWGRAPNAEMLDQAAQGGLDTQEKLSQVAATMLADPRAQQFFGAFFRQWLGYDLLRAPSTPPAGWSDTLLPAMQDETDRVLSEFAWGGKDFLDVLTTNHTKVAPALATFYGLGSPAADQSVEIPATHTRANTGLLTHASLLSGKSDGDLIAIRGNWLRKTFLCQKLEVPAAVAEQLGELLVGLTRVQIVQKRNTEAACRGCHSIIDPIGVGFAQFDRTGRFDSALTITEYGVTPGLPDAPDPAFASIAELSAKLRALPAVQSCLTAKAFLYVSGREAASADSCTVSQAAQAFATNGNGFPVLLKGLVEAPAFRLRRAAPATP
jgi:hypothetical protein